MDNPTSMEEYETPRQHYKLSWSTHQPNFISSFTVFLNTGALSDCYLSADGQQIPTHRLVLAACSSYFLKILTRSPPGHPVIVVHDVSLPDLKVLVDFMYYGEVNVAVDRLKKIIQAGKALKIKGIIENADHLDITRMCNAPSPVRETIQVCLSDSFSEESFLMNGITPPMPQVILTEDEDGTVVTEPRMTPPNERRKGPNSPARRKDPRHEPNFILALQAVRFGSMGFCKAARIHGVNNRTLWLEYNRLGYPIHRAPPKRGRARNTTNEGDEAKFPAVGRSNKRLCRQARVYDEAPFTDNSALFRGISEPAPVRSQHPALEKNASHPPLFEQTTCIMKLSKPQPTRLSAIVQRNAGRSNNSEQMPFDFMTTHRASHCPVMRTGPALSCNYCWNTLDECGRILRRKTKFHCPECKYNLCIVPCFHQYHSLQQQLETT